MSYFRPAKTQFTCIRITMLNAASLSENMPDHPSSHIRSWDSGQKRVKQQHTDQSSWKPHRSAHTQLRSVGWAAWAEGFPAPSGGPGHPGAGEKLKEPRFRWIWCELDWSAWDSEDQTHMRSSVTCVWCLVCWCNETLCLLYRCHVYLVWATVRLRTEGCMWPVCPGTALVLL